MRDPVSTPSQREYRDFEPCQHPGCLSHVSHPCEGCGRIAGRQPSAPLAQCDPRLCDGWKAASGLSADLTAFFRRLEQALGIEDDDSGYTPDVWTVLAERLASRSSGEDSARQDARDDFFSAIVAVAEAIDTKQHGPNRALHRRSLHAVAVPLADILRAKALCEANDRAARAAEGSA